MIVYFTVRVFLFFLESFFFYFIFKLYITILVLPNIKKGVSYSCL